MELGDVLVVLHFSVKKKSPPMKKKESRDPKEPHFSHRYSKSLPIILNFRMTYSLVLRQPTLIYGLSLFVYWSLTMVFLADSKEMERKVGKNCGLSLKLTNYSDIFTDISPF
jgi:hypothetical protein